MADPGWDIPGVPREAPCDADVPAAAGGSAASATASSRAASSRRATPGRRARAGSVSASSGLSAGAFAPLPDGSAPTATWPADSHGVSTDSVTAVASAEGALDLQPFAFPRRDRPQDNHGQQQTAVQQEADAGKFGQLDIAAQRIDKGEDPDTDEDASRDQEQPPAGKFFGGDSHWGPI